MTKAQTILLQTAVRQLKLNDAQYRTLLRSVARVESSKQLSNAAFEKVMAVLEAQGFRHPKGEFYFRDKVSGDYASSRAVRFIQQLAEQSGYASGLATICERFSGGRTREVGKLTPGEAYKLTEMLKSKAKPRPAKIDGDEPGLFGGVSPSPARAPETFSRKEKVPSLPRGPRGTEPAMTEEEIPF